ncbi:uncharacterized protein LOC120177789 [Hibiscus syriacus]|uniref:uncharacterized protein LOC120177789 n=1 Tax=Hibiscus syriacus TaxID=106335 RepID=UPI00192076B7|nr:uncharacterized protein LOC120177789 [Hibiscus syriacus]
MVANTSRARKTLNTGCGINDDEIVVLDEDYVIDKSDAFPTIKFSEKVHDQIDKNMRNVIIVRLLGRMIGYKALLNRIQALWKPIGEIQLIDLENNYFLVKFADEDDYTKVLTEGPWIIYGSYLIVQPWSRSFSISEKHPSQVIVWIRLPGLPYRYYTKALFRLIASVVGRVIKVDYNTQAGERGKFARIMVLVDLNQPLIPCIRIDGFTQKLEYEGLQQIFFHCGVYGHIREQCAAYQVHIESKREEELNERNKNNHNLATTSEETMFGPWMVVENRRRKTTTTQKTEKDKAKQKSEIGGSSFIILNEEENGYMAEI